MKRQLGNLPVPAKITLCLLPLLLLAAVLLFIFLLPRHISSRRARPPSPPGNSSMDPDNTVEFDFSPFLILYKSGRVERMGGNDRVPAGVDDETGVTSKDVVIDQDTGLSARMYMPPQADGKRDLEKLPIVVFYHGGAFVIESAFSPLYHKYLNSLAAKARVVAMSVEYRLAPEHPVPTAYDDSWQALNWMTENANAGPELWLRDQGDLSRLFLAGDSVGGNIAHNMAMRAGREWLECCVAIKGILLLDPYFWGKQPVGAETTDSKARQRYEMTWSFVCNGRYGIDDPLVNPVAMPADEWRKLACKRVAVTVSELDPFSERGKAYVDVLHASGWAGEAELYETEAEDHTYFLWNPKNPKAVKELEFVSGFLSRA